MQNKNKHSRLVTKARPRQMAHIGFLLPNLLGFLVFTLMPVLLSFWMAFTNWTLKPAVHLEFLGLRNFSDLLGVRALDREYSALKWAYVASAAALWLGIVGALWAVVAPWRGVRLGGALMALLGVAVAALGVSTGAGQGVVIAGLLIGVCGVAATYREDGGWQVGPGTAPALLMAVGCAGLGLLHHAMWARYEPKDPRFWQYLYNTAYLMLGLPFSIAGSLALALLLNDDIPLGRARLRAVEALICVVLGLITTAVGWGLGYPNIGLMGGILWGVAALGCAVNVIAFRTLFYLPTFTAGVALMILWKALYNPETGPINAGLTAIFAALGLHITPPEWLASVEWAKPALIIMGVWIGIGGTNMLLYLAGLSNVPRELLDAAEVDGASGWKRFRHVTWPQLAPTTFFITIMATIGGMQGGFEQARVMTAGGPAGSTTTLSYYIYNKAFQDLDLGYAAAISWVLFAIIFVATAINWKFGRELEVEG